MHNVVNWPNILQKSCGVHARRFLKYVWPFYNIMHERVKHYRNLKLRTTSFELKNVTFETNPRDKTPSQDDYMWLKDKALLLETAF